MCNGKTSFPGRRLAACLTAVLLPLDLFAQTFRVSGVVEDSSGETIIGAAVIDKAGGNAAVTDIDGAFTLDIGSADAVLTVSCLGYKEATVGVDGQLQLSIVLTEENETLNEVVFIGYGSMKKRDLTGAVASMSMDEVGDTPVSNLGQAIEGRIPGVQVVDAGKPGDNVNIKIRGLGSINNCDPLVVIDGVPTDLGLSSLNTADIERLDVLKDASATAIYGSRGANGVVMITTKHGAEGKGKLVFSANVAFQNATNVPDLLDASQYAALSNEMLVNAGYNPNPIWTYPETLGKGTDWMDELLRTGIMQNYTVSYSGGGEKYHYYISGGFVNQTGIVKSVSYRRFTFQSNNDVQATKWLKLSNNLTFSTDVKKSGGYDISRTMMALPTFAVKDENGDWTGPEGRSEWYGSVRNPIGTLYTDTSKTNGYNFLANITAEITFTKWLKFRSTFGYDAKFWYDDNFTPKYDWKPTPVEQSSRYEADYKSFTYLTDNYFLFDHTFKEKHYLGLMVGMSAQWNDYSYLSAQKNVFMFDTVNEMDNGEEMYSIGGNSSAWSLLSYMARANYSYDDRYLVTATVRRDGSSRFGKNNRWGTFPSASAAWRLTKENWFPKNQWVNDLKLRIGYGVTGSQAGISEYGYLASYNTSVYPLGTSGGNQTALVALTLANPDLHWEQVAQTNIGIDASLFNTRLVLSVDGYFKKTTDMLVKASIPITSGYEDTSTTYTNAGKVSNKGIEMTIHSVNFAGEFRWETTLNATYNRNKILDLNSDVPYYINQYNNSYVTMLAVGYPINVFYGYVTDGIFQNSEEILAHAVQAGAEPGDIRFKDLNSDGVINDEDRTVIGDPNPKWLFSMDNTFSYKGFELTIYLQGVAGNQIFNVNDIDMTGMYAAYNQTTAVLKRWTGEGTSDTMPRAVYGDPNENTRISDRYVENGSYLRVKSLSLAYNFPKRWLAKLQIENARLSFSCENLATISGYSGFDPEVDINGIDSYRYPLSRTFSIGLNFNF